MAAKPNTERNRSNTRKKHAAPEISKGPTRVVVDEIFDNGTARLLEAKRATGFEDTSDLGIDTWGTEEEKIMRVEDLEFFIGFPPRRHLREGDVFFVKDGSLLDEKYIKNLKQEKKSVSFSEHLLRHWDRSKELARQEIKGEFYKLTVHQIKKEGEPVESYIKQVTLKIHNMLRGLKEGE